MVKKFYIPEEIDLSFNEMKTFDLLYRNKNQFISVKEIFELAIKPGAAFNHSDRKTVWVTISRMRKKGIEIENFPGAGYRYIGNE